MTDDGSVLCCLAGATGVPKSAGGWIKRHNHDRSRTVVPWSQARQNLKWVCVVLSLKTMKVECRTPRCCGTTLGF